MRCRKTGREEEKLNIYAYIHDSVLVFKDV
jgi:hypothetical protein